MPTLKRRGESEKRMLFFPYLYRLLAMAPYDNRCSAVFFFESMAKRLLAIDSRRLATNLTVTNQEDTIRIYT